MIDVWSICGFIVTRSVILVYTYFIDNCVVLTIVTYSMRSMLLYNYTQCAVGVYMSTYYSRSFILWIKCVLCPRIRVFRDICLFCLSVCLLVCKSFNLSLKFRMICDGPFIFQKYIPCVKNLSLSSKGFDLVSSTSDFDLLSKTLTLAITVSWVMIYLSYFRCLFLVTTPSSL